jgi:hypothetical protein
MNRLQQASGISSRRIHLSVKLVNAYTHNDFVTTRALALLAGHFCNRLQPFTIWPNGQFSASKRELGVCWFEDENPL